MEETVEQLKFRNTIEDIETAIFCIERGMPSPHPKIPMSLKTVRELLIAEYNNTYAKPAPEPESESDKTNTNEDE